MSDTSEPPPSPQPSQLHNQPEPDLMSDVILWRRKKLNVAVLFASSALWTVMEFYQYNFITVVSWAAMAVVACLFFWGNIHRLLKREAPDLSELEIREETAMEHANSFRHWAEEAIRLMFHVSSEREWFVFVEAVASLFLISIVSRKLHFLTILYIGVVGMMTIPVIYIRNEKRITEMGEKVRVRSQRLYSLTKQKFQEFKTKIGHKEVKEKKQE